MKQIVLENENLKVVLHPHLGGKITSFYLKEKDFELAAESSQEQTQVRSRMEAENRRDNFAPYAYGMDDAFPNVNQEMIDWDGRKLHYPDHGEIWSADFEICEQTLDKVRIRWHSLEFNYSYEKCMKLNGHTLEIEYQIENYGNEELPCIWTWHGLLRYEQDMEIILPEKVGHYRNVLDDCILGEEGTVYPLQNDVYDFTKMLNPEECNMIKYYNEEDVTDGHCGIYYPTQNVSHYLDYDAKIFPYLGIWITAGGFQGDFNVALEPTNGYYDRISKARDNQKLPILRAGEELDFTIKFTLREGR